METQITVRLSEELAERLERAAQRRALSRSQLVRRAIRAFLEQAPPGIAADRPLVRDLEGAAHAGPPDLGAAHRDYLKRILRGG